MLPLVYRRNIEKKNYLDLLHIENTIVRLYLVSLVSMSSRMLLDAERPGQDVASFVCSVPGNITHSSYLRNFDIRRCVHDFIHDLIFGFKDDFWRHLSSLLEPLYVYTAPCRARGRKGTPRARDSTVTATRNKNHFPTTSAHAPSRTYGRMSLRQFFFFFFFRSSLLVPQNKTVERVVGCRCRQAKLAFNS